MIDDNGAGGIQRVGVNPWENQFRSHSDVHLMRSCEVDGSWQAVQELFAACSDLSANAKKSLIDLSDALKGHEFSTEMNSQSFT